MPKNDLSATNTAELKVEGMPNPSEQMKGIPKHHEAGAPNPCTEQKHWLGCALVYWQCFPSFFSGTENNAMTELMES